MARIQKHGNRYAYAGVLTGLAVSVAANVAHEFIGKSPEVGAVASAVFWPVALLLTTEILTRKEWPDSVLWVWVRILGLIPVALVAGVISYGHLHSLLLHYGESPFGSFIGPFAIDGLMLVSSAALLAPERKASKPAVKATGKAVKPVDEIDHLILVGRAVIAELDAAGRKVSRTALVKGVRAHGVSINMDKAAVLLERLAA